MISTTDINPMNASMPITIFMIAPLYSIYDAVNEYLYKDAPHQPNGRCRACGVPLSVYYSIVKRLAKQYVLASHQIRRLLAKFSQITPY